MAFTVFIPQRGPVRQGWEGLSSQRAPIGLMPEEAPSEVRANTGWWLRIELAALGWQGVRGRGEAGQQEGAAVAGLRPERGQSCGTLWAENGGVWMRAAWAGTPAPLS